MPYSPLNSFVLVFIKVELSHLLPAIPTNQMNPAQPSGTPLPAEFAPFGLRNHPITPARHHPGSCHQPQDPQLQFPSPGIAVRDCAMQQTLRLCLSSLQGHKKKSTWDSWAALGAAGQRRGLQCLKVGRSTQEEDALPSDGSKEAFLPSQLAHSTQLGKATPHSSKRTD